MRWSLRDATGSQKSITQEITISGHLRNMACKEQENARKDA